MIDHHLRKLTIQNLRNRIRDVCLPKIISSLELSNFWLEKDSTPGHHLKLKRRIIKVYGVPNGGIPATLLLCDVANANTRRYRFVMEEIPTAANLFFDDIVDSGKTRDDHAERYGDTPFFAIVDKTAPNPLSGWIEFPWERMQKGNDAVEDNIRRILQFIGEDPDREGLKDTPSRVMKSYQQLYGGYKQDPADVATFFEDGSCDEMVILKDIEFSSTCEHHMLPFLGTAHIAYIPDGRVIGISKLARVLEVFTRRLQIQERITTQVTESLDSILKPMGSACVIEAKHLCMSCRGVNKQQSKMITSSLTGAFRDDPKARAEFLSAIRG